MRINPRNPKTGGRKAIQARSRAAKLRAFTSSVWQQTEAKIHQERARWRRGSKAYYHRNKRLLEAAEKDLLRHTKYRGKLPIRFQ